MSRVDIAAGAPMLRERLLNQANEANESIRQSSKLGIRKPLADFRQLVRGNGWVRFFL